MSHRYLFHRERLTAAVKDAAGAVIDEGDLEENWDAVVEDGSEWALVVTQEALPTFIARIANNDLGPDERHGAWHGDAMESLRRHDDCQRVVDELRAERDDVIASIIWARDYLFNDIYPGEFGDLYVDSESLLNLLRPRLPRDGKWRRLLPPEVCPACWGTQFGHEEECSTEEREDELIQRRKHLIASHMHCDQIGEALIAHTARCLGRAEQIAARIHEQTMNVAGNDVVRPHSILPLVRVADLNLPVDGAVPAALGATIYPALKDEEYCREDSYCTTPHRACRYLVS